MSVFLGGGGVLVLWDVCVPLIISCVCVYNLVLACYRYICSTSGDLIHPVHCEQFYN